MGYILSDVDVNNHKAKQVLNHFIVHESLYIYMDLPIMSTSMADFETKLKVFIVQNLNGHLATLTQIKVTIQTVGLNLSL